MSKRLAKVTVQQLPRLLISTHVAWFASKQKSVQHCQQLCSTMSKKASINGYSAWSNMRLVRGDCETEDILKDIMSGVRMKVLLEGLTGSAPKRLGSLDGLTTNQKVTRVDWFIDALKSCGKLPKSTKVDSQMFALHSADDVFPVFWTFVSQDVMDTWRIAPLYQKHTENHIIIADPLEVGPRKITNITSGKPLPFYISASGKSVTQLYKRTSKTHHKRSTESLLMELVNGQLKNTVDGRKLHADGIQDLVDSRVLCALVNSLVAGTFTSEVLLSDRWTINLALEASSKIFGVKSQVDSGDLNSADEQGVCAFLAYFIMAGYQFRQAQAVLDKLEELKLRKEDLQGSLKTGQAASKLKKQTESKLSRLEEEVKWIQSVYNVEECSAWVTHAREVQAQVRATTAQKMKERFDVITVPRPMTINQLTDLLVVNLSLTGGSGFYCTEGKETLSSNRRLVIRDKKTGEFWEDFSGSENPKGSVREILKLHPFEVVEVNAGSYTDYEVFFESHSRNKTLKAGSKFLYQVFPGTTSQCQRLLLRAARVGEITTIKKLLLFFHDDKSFVNFHDPETGNTALHLASRHGHFDIALLLLESGASVNSQNNPGCSPFFLATEGLHKSLSNLLIEWGADINLKNKVSKTALELIRNSDLKEFLKRKSAEHQELISRVSAGDREFVERRLKAHTDKEDPLASVRSRCVRGNTLFHIAASLGSETGVELLLSVHVDPNIVNAKGATPLHLAGTTTVSKLLLTQGANVNAQDCHGNTPLHMMCQDPSAVKCIEDMVKNGAQLNTENNKDLLPIHLAASHGLISVIEGLLGVDPNGVQQSILEEKQTDTRSFSLLYLALIRDHLDCACWLSEHGFCLKVGEADKLALRILNGPPEACADPVETFVFLIGHGANPNAEYTEDNRPLHLAARLTTLPEITELLIENGAEVDSQNSSLHTPLSVACKANNPSVAGQLINKGASCQIKDVHGKCPFDYVKDHREWIDCGYFNEEINARLKAYSLKHAKDMVSSISRVVKVNKMK